MSGPALYRAADSAPLERLEFAQGDVDGTRVEPRSALAFRGCLKDLAEGRPVDEAWRPS